jgi:predicted dehydrogenase
MTERYEITNMIQRDLIQIPGLFGELETGTPDNPAVMQESVHYFCKEVSGSTLVRPSWFFDINQEGEGLVDVATHLVDLIQWECFPQQIINYEKEITITDAKHWPTPITISQFKKVTQSDSVPDYLQNILEDSILNIYANGEILYKVKGLYAKVAVKWDFETNEGHGDTHYSIVRGTKSDLTIKQGKDENYKPTLYITPHAGEGTSTFDNTLTKVIKDLQTKYAGLNIVKKGDIWEVVIPDMFKVGHEAHFGQVMEKYLRFLKEGELPEWEVPNMLAKYYTTTKGLEIAREKNHN